MSTYLCLTCDSINRDLRMAVVNIVLITFLSFISRSAGNDCPPNIICYTEDDHVSCSEGSFYKDNYFAHECCPGCVSNLQGEGESCLTNKNCQPGLKCEGTPLKKCVVDNNQGCIYNNKNVPWTPSCDKDGTYSAKQCTGERLTGRCFCYSKDGNRIFGESAWIDADDMECRCSRMMEYLTKVQKKTDVTIHCDEKGNFDVLQCYNGLCWCADTKTGLPYTMMVPEDNIIALSCYMEETKDIDNLKYYKRCDSQYQVGQEIKNKLSYHGTEKYAAINVKCDPDGSYQRVQVVRNRQICVSKNNTKLMDYGAPLGTPVDCNCAYDEYVTETLNGKNFFLTCETTGNYAVQQKNGEDNFCVDSNGVVATCSQLLMESRQT